MQIEVLETFLKIAEVGSFNQTAHLMYISQPTVTARIQTLEANLGQKLFQRVNAKAQLTQAGRTFLPYAQAVVRNWRKAKQEIALPTGFDGILTIAAAPSLWHHFLLERVHAFQRAVGTVAINAIVGDTEALLEKLHAGEVDVAVLHEPSIRADLSTRKLFSDALVLVSTEPRGLVRWDPKYVYIDWGETYREQHYRAYPVDDTPIVTFNDAKVAADYLMEVGGSAYLPSRWLALDAYRDRLHVVADAPVFTRDVFIAYNADLLGPEWRRAAIDDLFAQA